MKSIHKGESRPILRSDYKSPRRANLTPIRPYSGRKDYPLSYFIIDRVGWQIPPRFILIVWARAAAILKVTAAYWLTIVIPQFKFTLCRRALSQHIVVSPVKIIFFAHKLLIENVITLVFETQTALKICLTVNYSAQFIHVIVELSLTIFFLQRHRKRESIIFVLSEYQSLALNKFYYSLTLSKNYTHAVTQSRYNFCSVIDSLLSLSYKTFETSYTR